MKLSIRRYSTLLFTGSLLMSAALPQVAIGATLPKAMPAQAVSEAYASNRLQFQSRLPLQESQSDWLSQAPTDLERSTNALPPIVARRVKREISRSFNIPVAKLRTTAAQARTWNGCLGLPDPLAFCTMIALPGWQVVVTGQQQSWVYHTTQDGSQIRLNETASLPQGSEIVPSFLPDDQITPISDESVVFQAVTQGGITGRTVVTKLTAEGTVSQQTITPNIRSQPVILKRVTPGQVAAFIQQVEQQKLNHLNRLRYLLNRGADLTTTQISTRSGLAVEFTDVEPNQLPLALQEVNSLWQALIRS
ncbi:MAG: hypothetical protein KME43_03365 [Myxacorys chilensis ATA2-1-KO14]|nr:hypothetical protein [Myxacorys chilensis ATA2-1-KO14]